MGESVNLCTGQDVKIKTLKILMRTAAWIAESVKILMRTDDFCLVGAKKYKKLMRTDDLCPDELHNERNHKVF